MTEENTTPEPTTVPPAEAPPAGVEENENMGDPRPNDLPIEEAPAEAAAKQGIVTMVEDNEPEPAQEVLPPIDQKTQAEMEAGRQKIAEHEGRQKLMEGKRASDVDEGEQVAQATSSNNDL